MSGIHTKKGNTSSTASWRNTTKKPAFNAKDYSMEIYAGLKYIKNILPPSDYLSQFSQYVEIDEQLNNCFLMRLKKMLLD